MTAIQAIRAYCLDCNDTAHNVTTCHLEKCPLWPFRQGKNPNIKRVFTEEQKKQATERLSKARQNKKKEESHE